jgi:hypothetical protein
MFFDMDDDIKVPAARCEAQLATTRAANRAPRRYLRV